MATLLPNAKQQFIDASGAPLAGGEVYMYVPNTTVFKDTWQDSGGTTLNTNPIVLDASGEAIIYGSGAYRQVVYDANGDLVWDQLTADTSVGGFAWGGVTTGSDNAQIGAPSSFSSQDGQQYGFIAGYSNSGPMTVNGIPVLRDSPLGPVPCVGGEVVTDNECTLVYEAARGAFHLTNPALGTLATQNANAVAITGGTIDGVSIATSTIVLKQSTSPAPTDEGDMQWDTDNDVLVIGNSSGQSKIYPTPNVPVFGCGRLVYTSTTVVTFTPFRGNLVSFPSGAVAAIGSAGVTSNVTSAYLNGVASQPLVASTLYYAYLANVGTLLSPTWVIDWSTTGHSADTTTGIEIKTGDASRVLIGMARPVAGPLFSYTAASRLVATWFNRSPVQLRNTFTTDRSTTSTGYTEVNSEIRCNFLSWGDAVAVAYAGGATNSGAGSVFSGPSIDGASTAFPATRMSGSTEQTVAASGTLLPSEGFRYLTLMGAVSGGTGTWDTASQMSMLSGVVMI